MSYSMETQYEIWDDQSGDHIEVGPDRDGLDLIEIRYFCDDKCNHRITMDKEQATLVQKALQRAIRNTSK